MSWLPLWAWLIGPGMDISKLVFPRNLGEQMCLWWLNSEAHSTQAGAGTMATRTMCKLHSWGTEIMAKQRGPHCSEEIGKGTQEESEI